MRIRILAVLSAVLITGFIACGGDSGPTTTDGGNTTDGGTTVTDGGGTADAGAPLNCGELIECSNNCTSQTCLTQCRNKATATAKTLYTALGTCIDNACNQPVGSAAAGRCDDPQATDCDNCVSNSQKSANGQSGVGMCMPVNDAACGACVAENAACNNDA